MVKYSLTLFILVIALNSCGEFKEPSIEYLRCCDLKENDQGRKQIGLTVRVTNPNNFPLKLKGYGLDVFIDGERVGRTESDETIIVAANDKSEGPIYIDADVGALLKGGYKLGLSALSNKGKVELGVMGWVKGSAKGLTKKVPINQKIPIKLGGGNIIGK